MRNDTDALREIFAQAKRAQLAGAEAQSQFTAHSETLSRVLDGCSGQSERAATVVRSLWGGELCDLLSGLDLEVAEALCAAIRLRALCSGDADEVLRPLAELALEHKESAQSL